MQLLAALALTCTACLGTALSQSNQETESNTSCVERLRMPVYPKLADQARISGNVAATVVLNLDGSVRRTDLEMRSSSATAKRLFAPVVEGALRASTFRKTCGGESVRLVFNFVLGEELDPSGLPQTVSFGYPNQFWISVPPKHLQP